MTISHQNQASSGRGQGQRPFRLGRPAVAGALAAVALSVAAGPALALWSTASTIGPFEIGLGSAGFAVERGPVRQEATGPTDRLSIELGPAEAASILADPAGQLALPFTVSMFADGNAGLDYTLELPQPAANTIFAASELRLFPVADPSACTAAAAPAVQGSTSGVVGIASGDPNSVPTSQVWCLTAKYDGSGSGVYLNGATVAGSAGGVASVSANTAWWTNIVPDAAIEPTVSVGVRHTLTSPSATVTTP